MKNYAIASILSLLALGGTAASASAAVPTAATFEGVLTSAGGGPAADGNYQITFAVYAAASGGSAVWTEGPVAVTAKGGQITWMMGSKSPLSAAGLNLTTAFLGIQIGSDPELPRQPLGAALFAQRAAVAEGVDCSGCVKGAMLDSAVLQPYAKTTDLSGYAKSTDLSGYAKTSDLGAYAKSTDLGNYALASSLAKVAQTGQYADVKGTPVLPDVAKTGSYGDLLNLPVLAKLGTTCGTGLVLNGLKADGSLNCGPLQVPPDYIDEISNNLIYNQFVDKTSGTADVGIPDGKGAGVSDSLVFPDIGTAQALWVDVDLSNSDVSKITIELYAPNSGTPYILYAGSKAGAGFKVSFNKDTPLAAGDMNKDWLGKNIAGTWSITVKDPFDNVVPVNDGKFNWAINIQTLSTKKIQIKGNLIVDSGIKVGDDGAACDATKDGTVRYTAAGQPQLCQNGMWTTIMTSSCPGPEIHGICLGPTGCGNCNFQNSANYCASKKADLCSDSQSFVLNYTRMLASNALWTNSFSDNDSGQWSEVNGGTGDDHSNGSGWTAQCCYNMTPPRPTDVYVGGVRVVYTHDTNTVYFRQAAVYCAGMKADLCTKAEYQILRTAGKLPNAGWGYWSSDHSDNDNTGYEKGIGPVSDDPNMGQHWAFMCCASQRKTIDCPPQYKEYGGVCTTKVENSVLSDWITAAQACGALNSKLCSISQSAVLRQMGILTSAANWTASYSDNDGGNASPGVGNAGDDHPANSQYGYACCW